MPHKESQTQSAPLREVHIPQWHEKHLRAATHAAGVALWSWNVNTDAIVMDGQIGVESVPGKGSVFWFTVALPLAAAPVALEKDAAAVKCRSARILVAEDIEMNRVIAAALLKTGGHEVTMVENGKDAIEAVKQSPFDLIFMDMEMPIMDGLDATRKIRGLDGDAAATPIVALTANALTEDAARCRAAGMNDHLAKPITKLSLTNMIEKWASNRELEN